MTGASVLHSVKVETLSSRLHTESIPYLKHEFIATAKQSATWKR